jgi:hydroxypyruvate isomerase
MPNLSICIEMFWRDLPFEQRIRRVRELGFTACEFWGWRNKDLDAIRAAVVETGLAVAAICAEPNFCLVDRDNDRPLLDGLAESVTVARSLGCRNLIVTTGNALADETFEVTRRRVVRKLRKMARVCAEGGVTLLLEPLNPLVDHRGYWLVKLSDAADIVQEVDSPNLKILDDLYHQQLSEGNLIANLTAYLPWIGHFHAAGAPSRHELIGGELDYRTIFAAIDKAGYRGYVGLEFTPTLGEEVGLKQALSLL